MTIARRPEVERSRWHARFAPGAAALGIYLAISVTLWWGAWSTHPTSTTTCGCGDAARYLWFLEWPAYALTHGHSVLYSTWLYHPSGLNLLNDTSVLAFGVVLAPVTWLFGPVASLNVASTLIPALSALSMFWLLRRWVSWAPAAFVGGLLYGFSPYIVNGVAAGWLNTMLAVPPLIVACLDELCVRRRYRPAAVGAVLGGLITLEFFISTEQLAITFVTAAIGLVALGLYAVAFHRDELVHRAYRIVVGFGVAGGVAVALLAYPLWFTFAGPAHLSGLVWPSVAPGYYGTTLAEFFRLTTRAEVAQTTGLLHRYGGYQGIALHQSEYLGIALVMVLIAGVVLWRRDRRLWLFATVGVASMALCLAPFRWVNGFWVPWRVLGRIPVLQNILPVRFASMTYLATAVMLGIIVDHARASTLRWARRSNAADRSDSADRADRAAARRPGPRLVAALVAAAVAVVAIGPIASTYADRLPLVMEPVVLPEWFATVGPHLPPGQVVLTYPAALGGIQASMAYQAVDGMSFALVGGDGPTGVPQRAGAQRPGLTVLAGTTFSLDPATAFLPASVAQVRRALTGWGTTLVVIPDQPGLPAYDKGNNTAYAVALMTATLGAAPSYRARAWTWAVGERPSGPLTITPDAFRSCVGTANFPVGPPQTVPDCVLTASTGGRAG